VYTLDYGSLGTSKFASFVYKRKSSFILYTSFPSNREVFCGWPLFFGVSKTIENSTFEKHFEENIFAMKITL